jgi:quercetin dioxygenase-like cupin family protein
VTLDRLEAGIRHRQPALQPPAERCGWAPPGSPASDGAADGGERQAEGAADGAAALCAANPATPATNIGNGPGAASTPTQSPDLPIHYQHHDPVHGIAFQVQRLGFDGLQVLDPRLVRIAPGACNERHRHAHESLFVVLEGRAEIHVGEAVLRLGPGGVAYVPRWLVHQSRNLCCERELLLLAITDFGLTGAVLGDYDRQTRLRFAGRDAFAGAEGQEAALEVAPPGPTESAPARPPLQARTEPGPEAWPAAAGLVPVGRSRQGVQGLGCGLGRRISGRLRRLWRSAWS